VPRAPPPCGWCEELLQQTSTAHRRTRTRVHSLCELQPRPVPVACACVLSTRRCIFVRARHCSLHAKACLICDRDPEHPPPEWSGKPASQRCPLLSPCGGKSAKEERATPWQHCMPSALTGDKGEHGAMPPPLLRPVNLHISLVGCESWGCDHHTPGKRSAVTFCMRGHGAHILNMCLQDA
jgi:hypothetical protein